MQPKSFPNQTSGGEARNENEGSSTTLAQGLRKGSTEVSEQMFFIK